VFRTAAELLQLFSSLDCPAMAKWITYCRSAAVVVPALPGFVLEHLLGREQGGSSGSWAEWGKLQATTVEYGPDPHTLQC